MYSFLVLGYVPGTNLQITFQTWLDAALLLLCAAALRYVYHRESLRNRLPIQALLLPQLVMAHTVEPLQAELAPVESWIESQVKSVAGEAAIRLKPAVEAAHVKFLLAYSRVLGIKD